ncbi:hypothetical protein FB379_11613 [Aeribacillus composti]|uniref:hypothetical protein n=1 Tax=Aeribacillus composti TaxID=1868734 RepID=UPI001199540C|nr:hypothetical protein [Aeribacillus composti]TVZ81655.1 hypothetical protein FB379_11613 [Aeribacillus composti]
MHKVIFRQLSSPDYMTNCPVIEDLETVPTAEKGEEVISRQDGFEVKIDIDDQEAGSELSVLSMPQT